MTDYYIELLMKNDSNNSDNNANVIINDKKSQRNN